MRNSIIPVVLAGAFLAGCSSHPKPSGLLVRTVPPGATCVVARDGSAVATVDPTPGIALLDETNPSDAAIECRRSGFAAATATVHPHEGDYEFFGSGTRYEYDNPLTLVLTPLGAAGMRR